MNRVLRKLREIKEYEFSMVEIVIVAYIMASIGILIYVLNVL